MQCVWILASATQGSKTSCEGSTRRGVSVSKRIGSASRGVSNRMLVYVGNKKGPGAMAQDMQCVWILASATRGSKTSCAGSTRREGKRIGSASRGASVTGCLFMLGPGPWLKTCNVSGYWWPLKLKARKLLVTYICILLLSKYDVPALHLGPKRGPRRRPRQLRGRRCLLPRRCHQVVLPARLAPQRRHQLPAFGRGLLKSPPLLPSPRSTSVMLAQEWQETRPRLELV